LIGFDIGSKYAKICQVERRGDKYFIKSALLGTLPAATDNPKRDNDALITRLKAILKTAVLTEKAAASSVGDSQIVARNFSFPELSPEELQGDTAVLGRGDAMTLQLETAREQQAVDAIVIRHQEMRATHRVRHP
jgi:Tfp pilus assembly PilM family ATPase